MWNTSPTIRDFDNEVHIVIGKRNIDRGQCFAFWAGMCLNCGSDSVFQQFWHYIIQRHFNVGKFGIYMTRNADFRAMTIFVFGNLLVKVRKFQNEILVCSIFQNNTDNFDHLSSSLEPVVCTILPKKEFFTSYLFEEQGTSEVSELFSILIDQGATQTYLESTWNHSEPTEYPSSSNK